MLRRQNRDSKHKCPADCFMVLTRAFGLLDSWPFSTRKLHVPSPSNNCGSCIVVL